MRLISIAVISLMAGVVAYIAQGKGHSDAATDAAKAGDAVIVKDLDDHPQGPAAARTGDADRYDGATEAEPPTERRSSAKPAPIPSGSN